MNLCCRGDSRVTAPPPCPPQIFHYTGGVAYVDNKGPFRDRLEFVGNPGRRDGSILLKNLEFADNGTFTCDAKNPPDIVGRPSNVRLLVFEKGESGGGWSPVCLSSVSARFLLPKPAGPIVGIGWANSETKSLFALWPA